MAVDFTSPVKTQNYDTGVLQSIRANQIAIASFLDGQAITGNTAGLKRYNASSTLFEKSDGTNWTEMPLGYLKLAGGQNLGAPIGMPPPTAPAHGATMAYVDNATAGKASTAALAAYAPLSGAAFTGSINTSGNLNVAGSAGVSGTLTAASLIAVNNVFSGNSLLTTQNTFYLGAATATSPIINFDGGDYLGFDRTANAFNFVAGGSQLLGLGQTRLDSYRTTLRLNASNDGSLAVIECLSPHLATYKKTGSYNFYWLRTDDGSATGANLAYLMQVNDAGNFTANGLLYGRGGGMGIGQVTSQQGGSPSGGALGDIFGIW